MTPQEIRNERLAKTLIHNLHRRHIDAFYCPTAAEAVQKVSQLIDDGSSVTWGGTMTVRDLGIPEALKRRGTLEVIDRDLATTAEEKQAMYLRAFSTDVYLSSANAISEDGVIVNIDGNGKLPSPGVRRRSSSSSDSTRLHKTSRLLLHVPAVRQRPSMPHVSMSRRLATSMARVITAIPRSRSAIMYTSSAILPMAVTSWCW